MEHKDGLFLPLTCGASGWIPNIGRAHQPPKCLEGRPIPGLQATIPRVAFRPSHGQGGRCQIRRREEESEVDELALGQGDAAGGAGRSSSGRVCLVAVDHESVIQD